MRINNQNLDLRSAAIALNKEWPEELQFEVLGDRVQVVAKRTFASDESPAATLANRLRTEGYRQFAVNFSPSGGLCVIDGKPFEDALNQWASLEEGLATSAVKAIKDAFYAGSFLSLRTLGLDTLPAVLDKLINLQILDLSDNKLPHFEAPETLVNLRELHLSRNKLTSFSIPDTLVNLQKLDLTNNPCLSTLPLSLGQCSRLTSIDVKGTSIPLHLRDQILAMCQAARDAEPLLALPHRREACVDR